MELARDIASGSSALRSSSSIDKSYLVSFPAQAKNQKKSTLKKIPCISENGTFKF